MTSTFNVIHAGGYERLMGRWSKKLAPLFIDFAGIRDGESLVDVGCGTGSLTFALADAAQVKEIAAIDFSPVFVEAANRLNSDPRIRIDQGDACALPYEDGSFDRALSLLVLHFVPEADRAVAEMRRVVRPGGIVAAAVWDHYGGMAAQRMFWDTLAAIDPDAQKLRNHYYFQPMTQSGELRQAFLHQGLVDIAEQSLTIRMDYQSFDDYWSPISSGEGSHGKYVRALDEAKRARLEAAMRAAYQAGRPDGPRSFVSVAWACRGTVPEAAPKMD